MWYFNGQIIKTPKSMEISDVLYPRTIFRDSATLTSLGIKAYREVTPDSRYYWNGEFTVDTSGSEVVMNSQRDRLQTGNAGFHPERQRALFEIDLQQARAKVSRASLWPQLSVQHTRQLEQESGDFTPNHSTQLVFRYQSNSGLRGLRDYQAQIQRIDAAEQNLQFVQRDITNSINIALVQRQAAAIQLAAQARSVESSDLLVASFLRQFKAGRKSWVEVLNADQEANEARLQVVVLKRDFWLANLRLALQSMAWRAVAPQAPPVYTSKS